MRKYRPFADGLVNCQLDLPPFKLRRERKFPSRRRTRRRLGVHQTGCAMRSVIG
jgi:hypothetical protein